jgi:hypothetical protein
MAKCQDMGDARVRAAGVLQHFERFVKARSKDDVSAPSMFCVLCHVYVNLIKTGGKLYPKHTNDAIKVKLSYFVLCLGKMVS